MNENKVDKIIKYYGQIRNKVLLIAECSYMPEQYAAIRKLILAEFVQAEKALKYLINDSKSEIVNEAVKFYTKAKESILSFIKISLPEERAGEFNKVVQAEYEQAYIKMINLSQGRQDS